MHLKRVRSSEICSLREKMIQMQLLYFFLLLVSGVYLQAAAVREECGDTEECVLINDCPWIFHIFENNLNDFELNDFLIENICGFEGHEPKVCCDKNIGPCVTASKGAGFCAPANKCTMFAEFLGQKSGDGKAATYKSKCVYGSDSEKKVCCPLSKSDETSRGKLPLPSKCGIQKSEIRIFGGNETDIDEFPWMVLLEYGSFEKPTLACGGTLISSRFVLTAAHCVRNAQASRFGELKRVRLGEYDVRNKTDCVQNFDGEECMPAIIRAEVETITIHQNYSYKSLDALNDIALIKLKEPVTFSDFVAPICLPINHVEIPKKFFACGWGKTENARSSSIKLKVQLPLYDKNECTELYKTALRWKRNLGPHQICAGGEEGQDICVGDSGGPLMASSIDTGDEIWYQYGIVSIGAPSCASFAPSVYTSVIDYIPWILETMVN